MKFSVVTISFNQAPFIEKAIRSVLEQDVDVEYIIVDPGSTDGSREIIEKYSQHIDHIVFEPDKGPIDGLNKGFKHATGDIYACMNSDDFYLPGGLKRAEKVISNHPAAGAWTGAGVIVDKAGKVVKPCYSGIFSPRRYALNYSVAIHQSTFYRQQAYAEVNGFNRENKASWDGEILYSMMKQGYQIHRTFESIGAFRIYDESLTGSGVLTQKLKEDYSRLRADLDESHNPAINRAALHLNSKITRAIADPSLFLRNLQTRVLRRSFKSEMQSN
ncbi:glycosyltransferase [Celeribacter baekdonensis]|uniref:glycosyltransferase n=1 Tax=Celeribacter baekdonensis TaxID=875171 RepID=UPI0026EB11AB|nr:glycosyltransferase [Celeribacter baekdonensis]|tara:strand:- start:14916 stop:15737 length:822 start_codon:yes stop_codon:yes gene_type:complete